MSRIRKEHIVEYIKFLYACKYRRSAPQELITQWSKVPNNEIDIKLKKLYEHWALTESEIESMESEFLIEMNKAKSEWIIAIVAVLVIVLLLIVTTQ